MSALTAVHTIADLRSLVARWRKAGERVALVPTMGALHEGHISLTQIAREKGAKTLVSIFVNPTQFAPHEDFGKYPRTFEADCARLLTAQVDAVFAPLPEDIYPEGFCTTISLAGPATAGLEDKFRPTHFAGVATIVAKLLLQATPDLAIFGQKDFQQLAVIRQMALDLDLHIEIIGAPTIRAEDGLALSSRNAYLSQEERAIAPLLHANMQAAAKAIVAGGAIETTLDQARTAITQAGFAIDYLELRDARSLAKIEKLSDRPLRLLAAARLGKTRLIDNIAVNG
jgi:pantoate--beta-alanine ligase